MGDIIHKILHLLTDNTVSISKRGAMIISVLVLAYLLNDTFNFSFNYRIDKKLEQMKTIQDLYPKGLQDSVVLKTDLDKIYNQIRQRKPLLSEAKTLYKNIAFDELEAGQKVFIYRLITGLSWFILMLIILAFDKTQKKSNVFLGLTAMAIGTNIILFMIPTFDNPSVNYIINLTWPFALLIVAGVVAAVSKK